MPTFRDSRTLAISENVPNLMAGSQFEFLGRPSRVQVYSVADLADLVDMEVFFGQELELSTARLNQVVAGTGPIVPDDLLLDDVGAPGDRLTVRVTEVSGAATGIIRTMVVITPVG